MGNDAVAGGEDVGEVGPHVAVDGDGAPWTEGGAGRGSQLGVGAHPDDDEDHVDVADHVLAVGASSPSPAADRCSPFGARAIERTVVPVSTSTPWSASWAWTRAPISGSTVGRTSGSCSIWVTVSPRATSASAISRPM